MEIDLSQIVYSRGHGENFKVKVLYFGELLFELPTSETTAGCERAISIFKIGYKMGNSAGINKVKLELTEKLSEY